MSSSSWMIMSRKVRRSWVVSGFASLGLPGGRAVKVERRHLDLLAGLQARVALARRPSTRTCPVRSSLLR
jgi:hypothetical protein